MQRRGARTTFASTHANEFRYTHAWGRWQRFDGKRWSDDATLLAFDYARRICRAAAAENENERKDTASAKKCAAVVSLAQSRPAASPPPLTNGTMILGC